MVETEIRGAESAVGFTPGPWSLEVGDHSHRFTHVIAASERTIHYKYCASGKVADARQDEADGRLIAAAPDLYEAVQRAIRHAINIGIDDPGSSYFRTLTEARAKADGRPPTTPAMGSAAVSGNDKFDGSDQNPKAPSNG